MSDVMALLELLADGDFHTGRTLGEQLGISRAAIWKQIQKLEALGIEIVSHRAKGYRIEGGLDLLNKDAIVAQLSESSAARMTDMQVHLQLDSTNKHLLQQRDGGIACLAEQQTAGRGRRGRNWVSPFGKNLYLSLSWQFDQGAAALEGLSLAVGVAVVEAINQFSATQVQLKWPNDLLWQGRKLGGILLEMTGDVSGACQVVVGIGLNVDMPKSQTESIDQPWVNLSEVYAQSRSGQPSRSQLAGAIVDRVFYLLSRYQAQGFSAWRDSWLKLDAFSEQPVVVHTVSQSIEGVAVGVDSSGALQVRLADQSIQIFTGGEVSLRKRNSASD